MKFSLSLWLLAKHNFYWEILMKVKEDTETVFFFFSRTAQKDNTLAGQELLSTLSNIQTLSRFWNKKHIKVKAEVPCIPSKKNENGNFWGSNVYCIQTDSVKMYTHCCTGERRTAFTPTVDDSRHTCAAGTFIHLPLFVRQILCSLIQARLPWIYNIAHIKGKKFKHSQKHTKIQHSGCCVFSSSSFFLCSLRYLGIHRSIFLEALLVFAHSRKL